MKKAILILIIVGGIVLFLRLLTPEDTWIKDKLGNWVKHSNPTGPMPTRITPKKPSTNRQELGGFCGVSSYGKCDYDMDCYISGCNSEVCQSKKEQQIMSACVVLDCHKKPEGISCGCKENQCQWKKE